MVGTLVALVSLSIGQHVDGASEVWATQGSDEYPFGVVTGIAELGDGRIVVADAMRPYHLHVLNGNGEVIARWGREGDGPGELRSATQLASTPEGGVAVASAAAVHEFDAQGRFLKKTPLATLVLNPKDLLVTPDAYVLSGALSGSVPNTAAPDAVVLFDRASGQLERSMHPIVPSSEARNSLFISGGPLAVDADGQVVVANSMPFRLVRYGVTPRELVSEPTLVPNIADDFTYRNGQVGGSPLYSHRWYYARVFYLEHVENGYVTVARWRRREGGVEKSVWSRYTQDGRLEARRELPIGYEVHARARDGGFLAVRQDEFGSATVVLVRVPGF
jgi:PAS domain-containing protein